MSKAAGDDRQAADEKWSDFFILNRVGEVEEVAAVMTFLASKDASYVTGSDYPVSGGYLTIGPEQNGQNSNFAGCDY